VTSDEAELVAAIQAWFPEPPIEAGKFFSEKLIAERTLRFS
jgi:hypothetical protein